MSEEVLEALMQLFAILTKQDGGTEEEEKLYVRNFLKLQLGENGAEKYYSLFLKISDPEHFTRGNSSRTTKPKLTSVFDSVKILSICKKINKTINQSQKIVVLVRLFELLSASMKLTTQRLAIIETVSEVFRIPDNVKLNIETFVFLSRTTHLKVSNILFVDDKGKLTEESNGDVSSQDLKILRVPEVNLYFIRYSGNDDIFLNGLILHKNSIYPFTKGSAIKLSRGKTVYYSDIVSYFLAEEVKTRISFNVKDLEYRFKNGETGIRQISFSSQQGNLIGIMGASGSGKTTLLNTLTGIFKPSSGEVIVNGINLHKDKDDLKGVIGYIPQDDLLIEELTVFENLYYNVKLCFKNLNEEEIYKKTELVLYNLGLEDKKNLKVGDQFNKTISGGQRKRLNIALELIREPSILFVDEPTSGLSSRDSDNVMDLLRELTLKGKLIFVVIHQPSSEIFKMFDNILILDTGGYQVYFGNPVEAVTYFKQLDAQVNAEIGECPSCGNVNPELIFNIIEARIIDEYGNYTPNRRVSPEKWQKYFKDIKKTKSENFNDVHEKPPKILNIPGWFKQIQIFSVRDFLSKISNRQYLLVTLLEAPVLAFILSYIIRYIADPSSGHYKFRENENIPIYIFMTLIVALFLGLTVSAEEIFRDRKILKREQFLHLSRSAYLISKIGILTLISVIQAASFVLVAHYILELREMSFYYWFAFFTTAICANLLGLNISASFNSAVTIYILIPLIIIPMMVLSGAMFSFDKLNRNISRIDKVPLLAELMPTKWSYEALMVKQFKDNSFQKHFYEIDKKITNSDFQLSYYIPELETRLSNCTEDFNKNGTLSYSVKDFILIKNELNKQEKVTKIKPAINLENIRPENFNVEIINSIESYISKLKEHYQNIFNRSEKEKTNRIRYLMENKKELYFDMLDKYHNESVSDQVRKIYEKNKLTEYKHSFVRQSDPVFLDPTPSSYFDFRSHFFAPGKHFAGRYFETFWFNMSIIWILILFLYISLYFGWLKKLVKNEGWF